MSSIIPKFEFTVHKGVAILRTANIAETWLRANFKEGEHGYLTYGKVRRKRTQGAPGEKGNQNGYYWAVVLPTISDFTGHTPEELHEIYKHRFASRKRYTMKDGSTVIIPKSTASMDTLEFTAYIDRICAEAAEMGCVVPSPEKVLNDDQL